MRNNNIDILRFLCAFGVVFIHCSSEISDNNYLSSLCRVAVPCFFIISGYFYSYKLAKKQIKKIVMLLLVSNLLYLGWRCLVYFFSYEFPQITFRNILEFIIYNESPLRGHLWYLGAILYTIIVVFLFEKITCLKLLIYVTPILLIGNLLFGNYSLLILNNRFSMFISRNWLFTGIPFFMIGVLMKKKKLRFPFFCIPLFILCSIIEFHLLNKYNGGKNQDLYISTIFLAIAIISFCIERKKRGNRYFAQLGENYSLGIYIIHPLVITCLSRVVNKMGLMSSWIYFSPLFVFFTSIILLWSVKEINSQSIFRKQIRK